MTFCIKDIDKIKLHKMCSEAMAYLSCSYDFGIMSIKRDVFLKSVNYFVTRNLGLFNTILANDRLAKENAFCLAIAERESLKFFSYISEEEAQLYHCAFWIAVNALMLKEHGLIKRSWRLLTTVFHWSDLIALQKFCQSGWLFPLPVK